MKEERFSRVAITQMLSTPVSARPRGYELRRHGLELHAALDNVPASSSSSTPATLSSPTTAPSRRPPLESAWGSTATSGVILASTSRTDLGRPENYPYPARRRRRPQNRRRRPALRVRRRHLHRAAHRRRLPRRHRQDRRRPPLRDVRRIRPAHGGDDRRHPQGSLRNIPVSRILIAGCNGQLGHDCVATLAAHEILALDVPRIDITSAASVRSHLADFHPDAVVNCAAYTAVDKAESDAALCRAVNAEGPRVLAEACRESGAYLVHVSTDYVFDGRREPPRPWLETDTPGPATVYGQTKLEGEQAIAASGCRHAILRTAWLYGAHGRTPKSAPPRPRQSRSCCASWPTSSAARPGHRPAQIPVEQPEPPLDFHAVARHTVARVRPEFSGHGRAAPIAPPPPSIRRRRSGRRTRFSKTPPSPPSASASWTTGARPSPPTSPPTATRSSPKTARRSAGGGACVRTSPCRPWRRPGG